MSWKANGLLDERDHRRLHQLSTQLPLPQCRSRPNCGRTSTSGAGRLATGASSSSILKYCAACGRGGFARSCAPPRPGRLLARRAASWPGLLQPSAAHVATMSADGAASAAVRRHGHEPVQVVSFARPFCGNECKPTITHLFEPVWWLWWLWCWLWCWLWVRRVLDVIHVCPGTTTDATNYGSHVSGT